MKMQKINARGIRLASAIAIALLFIRCGGPQGIHQPPPPPLVLNTLIPDYVVAGTANTSIVASGTGFTSSSVVEWNGTPLPTVFGTTEILTIQISSALIARPGTVRVAVKDSSLDTTSKPLPFGIASAAATTAGVVGLVTVAPDGTPANGDSLVSPSISATGRYVAFQSNATNLAAGPASGFQEIYERDTCIGAPAGCVPSTIRVSVTYDGSPVNFHSLDSGISASGRYVVFESEATNILPNTSDCKFACVFLRDTCIGASGCVPGTSAISVDLNGNIVGGGGTSITPDGRFVVFGSKSPNVALGETNGIGDIYIRDICNGAPSGCIPATTLVSGSYNGTPRDGFSGPSAVSSAARYVAFQSWATTITPNENVVPGNFWRDTCAGASSCTPKTVRVDVTANGGQPNNVVSNGAVPAITSDGRLVAFSSIATNLVSTNVAGNADAYVRDTCAGVASGCTPTTTLASLANDGTIGNCQSPSQSLAMTPDGRYLAFDSTSTNLVPGDTFPACGWEDIFVRDTCFGITSGCTPSTVRVSVANTPNPETQADGISGLLAMSADGHYVVFISAATNLVPGVTGNGRSMVYLAKTGF